MYIRITYGNEVSIFMSVYSGKGLSVSLQDCMHGDFGRHDVSMYITRE